MLRLDRRVARTLAGAVAAVAVLAAWLALERAREARLDRDTEAVLADPAYAEGVGRWEAENRPAG